MNLVKTPAGTPRCLTPADWVNTTFHCGGEDITDRVQELIAIFILTKNRQYEESHGAAFLAALDNSSQWAEKAQQSKLADCLRAAEKDFKTIFDSPLDVDSYLLGIIWDILWPELERCTSQPVASAEQPVASENKIAEPTKSDEQNQEGKEGTVAKSRFLRINEECVDTFLHDVAKLFISCERLKDLQNRMADEIQMSGLVDELRQINAALSSQTNALQNSVVALRKVPVRGLILQIPAGGPYACFETGQTNQCAIGRRGNGNRQVAS